MNEAAPAPVTELENARDRVIAVIGNPNTGKSTLFNALTGLRQKTANYPGVTVERHTGHITLSGQKVTLVDLPGAYSIAAQSPDEMVAIDVLLGHVEDLPRPRAILAVVDATNLRRNLFLVTQLAELGLPMVIGLNMTDLAAAKGIEVDITALGKALGAQVVALSAARGIGLDDLRAALARAIDAPSPPPLRVLPTVNEAAADLWQRLRAAGSHLSEYEIERALIDAHGAAERRFELSAGEAFHAELLDLRARLSAGSSLAAMEATARYGLINALIAKVERRQPPRVTVSDRIDSVTNHPVIGSLLFLLVMAAVFQAVFSWAAPLMDLIDGWASGLGEVVRAALPPGAISSLLVDGVIAGVGGVVIFLPQIMILFAFIIVLEDSGYMPRVAFMVDRLMRSVGLSGQSFIPMLSSFACAVPGIMATRVIPERRDRIATILAAPFMTCSARLPIYALLIGAFIPDTRYLGGLINLQGMVLLGLYLLGIVGGIFTALLLKRTALSGPTPTFMIELPPYRLPNLWSVAIRLAERGRIFLVRAGTVIFSVAVLVWALVYFPRPPEVAAPYEAERAALANLPDSAVRDRQIEQLDNRLASAWLEQSWLGRAGHFVAPAFAPLGWDWKVSAAVIAGFPAREVVIAVLSTIYSVGDQGEATDSALRSQLKRATWPDGSSIYTLPMVVGLLIFYAFCLQCAATLAVIYRETNSLGWPVFAWLYMTGLGYTGALLAYQLGS
ncbi:MAG: ferrous iron transport protein B [Gammaproteobacteria bacterium]|nr:ferrous iron transport protein B [Gammaproteobacteria bacterium]MCP5139059.1 ferrous iron transport protein B [Chromatiales bacterium]